MKFKIVDSQSKPEEKVTEVYLELFPDGDGVFLRRKSDRYAFLSLTKDGITRFGGFSDESFADSDGYVKDITRKY